jgi:hypothetical protein
LALEGQGGLLAQSLLPAAKRPKHHAALPYAKIGGFMADLRQREAVAARAL